MSLSITNFYIYKILGQDNFFFIFVQSYKKHDLYRTEPKDLSCSCGPSSTLQGIRNTLYFNILIKVNYTYGCTEMFFQMVSLDPRKIFTLVKHRILLTQ